MFLFALGSATPIRRPTAYVVGFAALGALFAAEASAAQNSRYWRQSGQGIESGPLPMPDPGSMGGGQPAYVQETEDFGPTPNDIAPDNGQSFTIFNRRF
jgi:hypothetical protein